MTEEQVRAWFDQYLDTFADLVSGARDDRRAIGRLYRAPLTMTTDDVVMTLSSEDDVTSVFGAQIDAMREAGFARAVPIETDVQVLNANTARYTALFARQRADGSEIERLRATYLIVDDDGMRIATVAVHS